MCEPVSITMGVLAAAQTVSSYMAQNAQADAVEKSAEVNQKYQSERIRDSAAMESRSRAEQGRRERARLMALAGESGVSGLSVDAQQQTAFSNESRDQQIIHSNARNALRNAATSAGNQMLQAPHANTLATGLKLAGTAASSYAYAQDRNNPRSRSNTTARVP